MIDKTDAAKAAKQLVDEVKGDFARRQEERRTLERGWQLNMNFLCGNQYCDINAYGEIEDDEPRYFWQGRRVFNYIAPTIDTRCAKLARIRPKLAVRAASDADDDVRSARISSAILSSVSESCNIDDCITRATVWSEACGTAFYKILWDSAAGSRIAQGEGGELREGGVRIVPVSPFEIYPASLSEESLENQPSIIHAKALSVADIYALYGVKLAGRDIDEFSLSPYSRSAHSAGASSVKAVKHGYEIVIERYERPAPDIPEGRLTVVAGDELLFDGALPYVNGEGGERGYPFVRQTCLPLAGGFFGGSIVDRLIPVQRAYNAVKNRKHEFLNRISMGTIAVEDGSVDTDELAEDGLAPGKILVYRRGGTPPSMLSLGSVPSEFSEEEDRLSDEFAKISGVGEITQSGGSFNSVTSATGLQLLIEQDEARLNVSYEQIKYALKGIGRHILRLYRQFSPQLRVMRCERDGKIVMFSFTADDVCDGDVVLEADSDINLTPARRRAVIYDLISSGLLSDGQGKIAEGVKSKILTYLGYAGFSEGRDLAALHRRRCAEENSRLLQGDVPVKSYDDHALHIAEHTAFILSNNLTDVSEGAFARHLAEHKKHLKEEKNG